MAQTLATTEVSSAMSRRRMAMMQRGAAATEQLSALDVARLRDDPSPTNRALIAGKFGAYFESLAEQAPPDLVTALLQLLVDDVETQVRRSLAVAVASSDRLPASVVSRLARDRIEVARPIIEESPLLQDEELIEIVRTNAMQYALAVAGRERVSETLSDALVDSGHQPVVARLTGNTGAVLSTKTINRVLEDWREDREVQDRLVRRPALPFELVEQMVDAIGDRIEWELIQTRRIDPMEARALMQAVRDRTAVGITAKEHGDRKLAVHLRERLSSGGLGHDDLLQFLREGDVGAFEMTLALMAKVDTKIVRRFAYNSDRRYLAALCVKAALPTPHYLTIRMALELAGRSVAPVQGGGDDEIFSSETMRYLRDQYEDLRVNEEKLAPLVAAFE
jgi:uncharacterized protein (DUF2336 family)